ncbi:hypothetical protein HYALB_00002247 [Hymenoscyphus albidus]|uniref:F-box domain-containing protein n=1 Tax=Hymenoscyphus albidus TaxID=595503 RepID=A0A9N9Q4V9_9HELO|nr:hypothetical protein HYALB_00002247 [Hymenoscyphus albidus]
MLNLITLPYEVLSNIVGHIDFDDVFSLGLTCKSFTFFITDESLAKSIILNKIPFSPEAMEAKDRRCKYAKALRLVGKRREAFASVSPYTVATLGFCGDYLYCKGVLCYSLDDEVRVLDLHRSDNVETVVSISGLLINAVSDIHANSKGLFQILYYSDQIVSCIYKSLGPDLPAWLIVFSLEDGHILIPPERLDSVEKLFVRHNQDFLYYGTHSEIDADGHKKWMIHGYDFQNRKWFDEKIPLSEMAGHDVGSSVCFEIHGDSFYAISSQTSFECEEIDWTSFYHGYRFPLNSPCRELLEKTNDEDMWRRQHQEGPIDERWMSMQLDVDESTGKLKIVEARKEWYQGSSKSQRNYYTTDIIFPKDKQEQYEEESGDEFQDEDADAIEEAILRSQSDVGNQSSPHPSSVFSASTSTSKATSSSSTTAPSYTTLFDNTGFPNSQLLLLRQKENQPHYLEAPPRNPHCTHPGDNGAACPTFTIAKTCVRTYSKSSNTYLDLVDDPLLTDWNSTQRVRLRAGSRKLKPPLRNSEGFLCEPSGNLNETINQLYRDKGISFWPRVEETITEAQLDELYTLLNPPTFLGNVQGTCDERSLVYVTGEKGKPQALIFVGFDAGMRLKGLRRWGRVDKKTKGVGEGPHIDGRATGGVSMCETGQYSDLVPNKYVDPYEKGRTVGIERKGEGREVVHAGTAVQFSGPPYFNCGTASGFGSQCADGDAQDCVLGGHAAGDTKSAFTKAGRMGKLIRRVPAMYLALTNLGYNFGRAQKDGLVD